MKETPARNPETEIPAETVDLFGDKVIAEAVAHDPLFKFLKAYWRQALVVVLAVFLGYFGNQFFQQSYVDTMKRSGDLFASVHEQMAALDALKAELSEAEKNLAAVSADEKKPADDKEAAKRKVSESKDKLQQGNDRLKELLLALSDSRKPYDSLARIYQGLVFAQQGDFESARKTLSNFNWQALPADGQERFFAEVAAMGLAGALLDNDATYTEARTLLKSLAESGAFLNIAASIRLARVSLLAAEKSEAVAVLESVRSRYPEQANLIDNELSRLKG